MKTRYSWANIFLFYSLDERDALVKMFEMLEDFKQEKQTDKEVRA